MTEDCILSGSVKYYYANNSIKIWILSQIKQIIKYPPGMKTHHIQIGKYNMKLDDPFRVEKSGGPLTNQIFITTLLNAVLLLLHNIILSSMEPPVVYPRIISIYFDCLNSIW